ncbi:uncharacterized protein Dwil_GK17653, isoform A [Drosophila willistoni]|uniref:Phosphatidylinositol 4-kinase beta n=2 Tax=Drosophila willistoni TaxID=7260 RepID=B4MN82_DROWI|nr:uncharacterized protein LOC6638676 [Drosophila willistoni]EDW73638.1 uncharacterized protein Dwil_GK17653, isoform A [Drosophila willistoni]
MNSVISAFKPKNKTSSGNPSNPQSVSSATLPTASPSSISVGMGAVTKKKLVAQDNGYQYLRHIREIETANKLLSPVVATTAVADEGSSCASSATETGILNLLRPAHGVNNGAPAPEAVVTAAAASVDVVDHCKPATVRLSDFNMNGNTKNGNGPIIGLSENGNCLDLVENWTEDDISEHSGSAACTSTSSSSEHSNSTVVHSPTAAKATSPPAPQPSAHSPSLSLLSTNTLSSLGSLDAASLSHSQPQSQSSENGTPLASPEMLTRHHTAVDRDYIPAFLMTAPVTLPLSNSGGASILPTTVNSAATTPKHLRYSKPRLSLSRVGTNSNHQSMPSVHGRPNLSVAGGEAITSNGANPPKRISTHQRNLSLDFRSMGILLPPVSQVTNTRINHTQHHRNRSLDSALQRIPEVEVSSPNAESENTFCSPSSILGTNMCSKIVTTAASVTSALSTSPTPALTSIATTMPVSVKVNPVQKLQSVACSSSKPSVVVESCPTLRLRPKSSEVAGQEIIVGSGGSGSSSNNSCSSSGSSKKREDLTSLGSDDSGIICGSESDQLSLNRICHSHESLDSGEMDTDAVVPDADADAQEECIDIMDSASLDEEYNAIMQTTEHLCCYHLQTQSNDIDCRTLRPTRKQKHQKLEKKQQQQEDVDDRTRYRVMNMSQAAINMEMSSTPNEIEPVMDNEVSPQATINATPTPTPTETTNKNDQILFKNFFGATKNAIFRTAQSIIENHEKKNAAKQKSGEDATASTPISLNSTSGAAATASCNIQSQDQVKSPTDISKKKEFFSLLTSNSSKKQAAAAAAAAEAATVAHPDLSGTKLKERTLNLRLPGSIVDSDLAVNVASEMALLAKSSSINSLNKLKVPVPGVVKYFISERSPIVDAQQKPEKGPSGLLRFFESPVFNIHFAVHYLFYSKEPGVLSFIGNKIFSFPDQEVDLYIPQLIVMYIQMDELAEVLDPYLTIRCRKSVDFSLKCLWLLEAYNYNQEDHLVPSTGMRKSKLALMKEIFSKKEQKQQAKLSVALIKKTHHRSQSDATVLMADSRLPPSISHRLYQQPPFTTQTLHHTNTPAKLCLGDITSGRAFDNGCTCFESVRGQVNGLLGQRTLCSCGAPKAAPQKEFMRSLMNVGKNLTSLTSKAEKTSALRMFLNLINKNLPARVWLPLYSDIPHHVVRITEEKTAVLNSKDKTPYIIYVEVVEVPDIYTSPLIPKMMPSLRHTKSEEHLDGSCLNTQHNMSCSRTSSCSSSHQGSSCRRKRGGDEGGGGFGDSLSALGGPQLHEDDVWSQEDDEITAQYLNLRKISERDAVSQMSLDSCDSRDQAPPIVFNIGDVRTRHCNNLSCENTKSFSNDPEDPSAAALKEPWHEKEKLIRESSPYGHLSNWRLLSAIVKCGDDLRQELMATQLLQMFKIIWQEEHVDLWVRPYKIVCLSNDSGLIEPILNTVSLHQIKKNSNKSLRDYFIDEYGPVTGERFCLAQKNFVQSCAAYCLISYLLQVKDRHNGNILFHSDGHIIHIDFGFILSISPKNLGFEQSPFKLTHEFVDVMGGTSSEHWREFNRLLLVGMMSARKHMDRIINFVEIMRSNAHLPCFKNGCSGTVQNLRKRFHMNLTEQEMERKVEQLVQDSLKSLSTKLYDGYQYYTNGIL